MSKAPSRFNFSKFEPLLFLLVVAVNLYPLFEREFFPYMDAPAHLYNSSILNQLFFSNDAFLREYFTLNKILVPNWFSYIILSPLHSFLSATAVEKVYLTWFFAGLPLAVRYCIISINPGKVWFSYLGIPFTYNVLSLISFYNFSSGLIFLFIVIGFSYRVIHQPQNSWQSYLLLFIFLILTYLCHMVVFCIALLYIMLIYVEYAHTQHGWKIQKWFGLKVTGIFLSALIPVILLFIYLSQFHSTSSAYSYLDLHKHLDYLSCGQIFIGFSTSELAAASFLNILLFILLSARIYQWYHSEPGNTLHRFPLIGMLVVLVLYFLLPDADGVGGFVTIRLCLLLYMVSLIYLSSATIKRTFAVFLMSLFILIHIFRLVQYSESIRERNEVVSYIRDQAAYIQPHSFVYSFGHESDWLSGHFYNYICLQKPVVVLQDYECAVGYFPLTWKNKAVVNRLLQDIPTFKRTQQVKALLKGRPLYLWFYGCLSEKTDPESMELKRKLDENCLLLHESRFSSLYQLK